MVCPFRTAWKYELEEVGGLRPTVTYQEQVFPECYEEECPYYEYPNGCAAVNKEIGEE